MSYDDQYARVDALFGEEPEATLQKFAGRLEAKANVLDVGAGQGRNSLFLAERGVKVHALEPSTVAATTLRDIATSKRLKMEVFSTTFERFEPMTIGYSGILVFGLMPDLDWAAIQKLLKQIDAWSQEETLLWVTGFTTIDPAFEHYRDSWEALGNNSFRSPDGQVLTSGSPGGRVRTYLEPGQILDLFCKYSVLHHWEGLGPEHQHGDGPIERHGRFEAVLLR